MSTPAPILQYTLNNKDLLPAGYTPLAYIESSGTLWINSEYVITSNKIHYSCKFKLGDLVSSSHIFGGNNSYSVYKGNPYISGNTLYFYINSSSYYNETVYKDEMLDIDMDMNAGSLNLYLNGKLHTASYSGTMSGGNSIALFHVNANNGTWNVIKGKMYYFKMWDNGSVVVDLRPCIQDSNGAIGMYDLVSRTFKTNSGSGSFIAGPPLAVGKGGGKSLPEEYLLVEWLLNINKTEYISINRTVKSNTVMKVNLAVTAYKSGVYNLIMGYAASTSWTPYTLGISTSNVICTYGGTCSISGTPPSSFTTVTWTSTNSSETNGSTLGLFKATGSPGDTSYPPALQKISYAEILEGTTLVHRLFPCYRKSDMKPGMYDTVNRVFYTNAGSGEFILGPTVSPYYSWEPNASSTTWENWYDPTEYSIATATYNPLPKIKVTPGKTYVLEYDVKAASNYTPTLGAILLEWFTSTSGERTDCSWTGINIPLTTSYKRISYEWTCPSGQNYVDFGRRASENVAHTIKNITWKEKNWKSPYPGLYTNVSSVYDSSKGWVADFNGSSLLMVYVSTNSILSNNQFSMSAWVKRTGGTTIFAFGGDYPSMVLEYGRFFIYGPSNELCLGTYAAKDTNWHHYVMTYNKSALKLYIDALEIGSSSGTFNLKNNSYIDIGGRLGSGQFIGQLTNFILWDLALTLDLIKELYGK